MSRLHEQGYACGDLFPFFGELFKPFGSARLRPPHFLELDGAFEIAGFGIRGSEMGTRAVQ